MILVVLSNLSDPIILRKWAAVRPLLQDQKRPKSKYRISLKTTFVFLEKQANKQTKIPPKSKIDLLSLKQFHLFPKTSMQRHRDRQACPAQGKNQHSDTMAWMNAAWAYPWHSCLSKYPWWKEYVEWRAELDASWRTTTSQVETNIAPMGHIYARCRCPFLSCSLWSRQ